MTESLYFEANKEKASELDRLCSRLGARHEDLLNEALDLLLDAHRQRQQGDEPAGMLAGFHEMMRRLRKMIDEVQYIRFTTCTASSIVDDLGVTGRARQVLTSHYEKIYQSSERALQAAGFGPMLIGLAVETENDSADQASAIAETRGSMET